MSKIEDIKKSIVRAGDVQDAMFEGFRNGKPRGETTHFEAIDPHFTWKKGFMCCWTGYPNHGKGELFRQLAITKAKKEGWKTAIFAPEDQPVEEFFDDIAHSYIGKSCDPSYANQMTESEYKSAIDFIHEHFYVVSPESYVLTPEDSLEYFTYCKNAFDVNLIAIDPWNKLNHVYSGREDTYLSKQFALIKNFTLQSEVITNIIAHPRSMPKMEGDTLPVPDQFSLSGGSMWNNAFDIIVAVHRPDYHTDKASTKTLFVSHKVKKQKLVGIPGEVELDFNRAEARYYQTINGKLFNPLTHAKIESQKGIFNTPEKGLHQTTFEDEVDRDGSLPF